MEQDKIQFDSDLLKDGNESVLEEISERFRRDGFVSFPDPLLSVESVDLLNDRIEHVLRGDFDRGCAPDRAPKKLTSPIVHDRGQSNLKKDTSGVWRGPIGFAGRVQDNCRVLQVINIHKCDRAFRDLATHPALGELVCRVAGWEEGARLASDQTWLKPPGSQPLTFHRDSPYFMFLPDDVVTVWIALDDMTPELGPLEYVKGSHLWGEGRIGTSQNFFQKNGGRKDLLYSAAERAGIRSEEIEFVSMKNTKAGGLSIHDGRTWHGSDRNKSTFKPRRGVGLHFVPAQVRFRPDAAKSILWKKYIETENGKLTDGVVPNKDFPIVWCP